MAGSSASLAVLAMVAAMAAMASADCPNYRMNDGCNTGSCASGGLVGNFSVPATPFPCGFGNCPFSGTIMVGSEKVKIQPKNSAALCCKLCKTTSTCNVWQWVWTNAGGQCFLYPGSLGPSCGAPYSTNVGSKCGTVKDDPHFVGAHGTHYDFNGEPGKTFCLVSDLRLHLNMKMTGYLDERTEGAALVRGGKAVRTWIRELGIVWLAADGSQHSLLLAARSGGETARGEGFLALAEADGERLARMGLGEERELAGGLVLKFVGIEKSGIYDIDLYAVKVAELLDMAVQLRVAHPLLRREDDAEAHISLAINWMQTTAAIHGVLGQTYREGREERTSEFSARGDALRHGVVADGESGRGFLDGAAEDYVASHVLAADCRYSGFHGRNLPTTAE